MAGGFREKPARLDLNQVKAALACRPLCLYLLINNESGIFVGHGLSAFGTNCSWRGGQIPSSSFGSIARRRRGNEFNSQAGPNIYRSIRSEHSGGNAGLQPAPADEWTR